MYPKQKYGEKGYYYRETAYTETGKTAGINISGHIILSEI
jgi:hypothetical protein